MKRVWIINKQKGQPRRRARHLQEKKYQHDTQVAFQVCTRASRRRDLARTVVFSALPSSVTTCHSKNRCTDHHSCVQCKNLMDTKAMRVRHVALILAAAMFTGTRSLQLAVLRGTPSCCVMPSKSVLVCSELEKLMSGCLCALHYLQLENGVSHPLGINITLQVILRICAPVCTYGAEFKASKLSTLVITSKS